VLARPEVAAASPVIEIEARVPGTDESLKLLGVDVLALARVSPALPRAADTADRFATLSGGLFVSEAARTALGVAPGGACACRPARGRSNCRWPATCRRRARGGGWR
jgi:hypothetical protein